MADQAQPEHNRQFAVQRIYTKDLSFESPGAPDIFRSNWEPKHELNINTKVNAVGDDTYEVVLSITVTTKIEDKTALIVEVHQAGLFAAKGFPEKELGPLLAAYCPNQLFPYAREVVADLVTKGSFPQIVLQPINFDALYAQHLQQAAQRADQPGGGEPPRAH
ncbi:MAG TPA: protein-export chaperone SecB [Chromatiaceae bacterium]|jgi:preprotein translocase subunit SecB|nr:protein-export chaperone SecB [Chromatiaceae bacterium]